MTRPMGADELAGLLVDCAEMGRQLDQLVVATVAALDRRGIFAEMFER